MTKNTTAPKSKTAAGASTNARLGGAKPANVKVAKKPEERVKPKTLAEAQAILAERRAEHAAAEEATSNERRAYQEARTGVDKAVKAENYAEAARLKEVRDNGEARIQGYRQKERETAAAFTQALADAQDLFFAERDSGRQQVTVTRVVVCNPVTNATDEAIYIDSSDTVQLRLGDERELQFESEGYHIGEWAARYGYFVKHYQSTVTV